MDYLRDEPFVSNREIADRVEKAILSSSNVLLVGESGVGKEYIARLIHRRRTNGRGEFKVYSFLDGSSLTKVQHLLEDNRVPATQRTLFFKRIDCLNWRNQIRLLELVEQRMNHDIPLKKNMNINFICSSELDVNVTPGTFWRDLLYRLDVIRIDLPPLRERKEEIPLLIDQFLHNFSLKYCKSISNISDKLWRRMLSYTWPGNVRELKNVVERLVLFAPGGEDDNGRMEVIAGGYDSSATNELLPRLDKVPNCNVRIPDSPIN